MITKSLAREIAFGTEIHCGSCKINVGPRGGVTYHIERWRVNGKVKTWKTRPDEFEMPIKHGLRDYSYVTHRNGDHFHVAEDCPTLNRTNSEKETA